MPEFEKQTTHLPSWMKELEIICKPITMPGNLKIGKLIYVSYQTNFLNMYSNVVYIQESWQSLESWRRDVHFSQSYPTIT